MKGENISRSSCTATLLFLMLGCGGGAQSRPQVFPTKEWALEAPEQHGLDTAALSVASDAVGTIAGRACLVVVKDGVVIHERAYTETPHSRRDGWSLTKSLGAAVFGVAVGRGLLSVDDPVSKWVPTLPMGMNQDATLRDVLGQESQSEPPGTDFIYDSGDIINTLPKAVAAASGKSSSEFARTALLEPTGMDREIDWRTVEGEVHFGEGSMGSCRGYARLGWLMLNRGNWNGTQLIPERYALEATHPSFPKANAGYGYLWWVNGDGYWIRPLEIDRQLKGDGPMFVDAPKGMFFGTGLFSQFIFVVPDQNLVVTTMGFSLDESLGNARLIWSALAPALR